MTCLGMAAKIHLILMISLYSLTVVKYNKNEFQNLQDLKETGKSLVMFKFKLGYVNKQLFSTVSMNFNKNGSFMVDVQQNFV